MTDACPGDRVRIGVVEEHPRWVRATIEQVLEPSPDRIEPPCPYAFTCGGCQWQHITYAMQLTAKTDAVRETLARIGKLASRELVKPCLPSPRQLGYRSKIELVTGVSERRLVLGYHRRGAEEIVPVDRCLLVPRGMEDAPRRLAGALRYLAGAGDIGITRVALRVAQRTKDVEIALWSPPGAAPRAALGSTLSAALPATSVVRVLYKGSPSEREVSRVEVLEGRGFWRERLSGHQFAVSAPSFFQVNTAATDVLVGEVLKALEADGSDRVLDVYAGVGTFTLPLVEFAGEVAAIEGSGHAVRDLRRNLESAHLGADVLPGDAARALEAAGRADLVIVDPPRVGLEHQTLRALSRTGCRRIVYVSCDPATLARDARLLADAGYALRSAQPVDLFPQSYHVETVATFDHT